MIEQEYLKPRDTEVELATLCLGYLSLDQFDPGYSTDDIRDALMQGYYAFFEYAMCYWPHHLEASLAGLEDTHREQFEEMMESLDNFLSLHWADSSRVLIVPRTQMEILQPIEQQPCYDRVAQAIVTTKNQLHSRGKSPPQDDILQLPMFLDHVRRVLEEIVLSVHTERTTLSLLEQLYGSNSFKCKRLNCQYFHQGFETQPQRDLHNSKHDRAFKCAEEGCPHAVIGYVTEKDLKKHTAECHVVQSEDYGEFPPDELDDRNVHHRKQPLRFQCTFCPKKFTRAYNLRSHLRTHTNEKPFVCTVCEQAFARANDRKRHELLHAGERKFVCRGELDNSKPWGCGRRFARPDALGTHFRTQLGRLCIQPLLDEEAAKRQEEWFKKHAQQPPTIDGNESSVSALAKSHPILPDALLQMYPDLANLDWSDVMAGPENTLLQQL